MEEVNGTVYLKVIGKLLSLRFLILSLPTWPVAYSSNQPHPEGKQAGGC